MEGRMELLEKSNEGNVLTMKAIAETLDTLNKNITKMVSKQTEEDEKEEEEKAIKAIAERVGKLLKQEKDDEEKVAEGVEKQIEEKPATITTKPEKQQEIIQGSVKKQDEEEEKVNGEEEKKANGDEEYAEKKAVKADDEEEEKKANGNDKEEDKYPKIEEMKKEFMSELSKVVDSRLEKMGFISGPTIKKVDLPSNPDADPSKLMKGGDSMTKEQRIEKLSKMSWSELSHLQERAEAGEITV